MKKLVSSLWLLLHSIATTLYRHKRKLFLLAHYEKANHTILRLGKASFHKMNKSYAYCAVHSITVNKYNGAKISVASTNHSFIIEARVFNEGVALRWVIANKNSAI